MAKVAEQNDVRITVGGMPPLSHFNFMYDNALALKSFYVQLMLEERGFLASTLFYAMYAHNDSHVAAYFDAASDAFSILSRAIASGSVRSRMKGRPATSGFKRLA